MRHSQTVADFSMVASDLVAPGRWRWLKFGGVALSARFIAGGVTRRNSCRMIDPDSGILGGLYHLQARAGQEKQPNGSHFERVRFVSGYGAGQAARRRDRWRPI
jgi:hypothetical protein